MSCDHKYTNVGLLSAQTPEMIDINYEMIDINYEMTDINYGLYGVPASPSPHFPTSLSVGSY